VSDETESYLPKKMVAKRYGSSTRSVDRWEADGTFPPGFYIKKRKFWRLSDLIRHERSLVYGANALEAEAAPKPAVGTNTTMEAADATS
jgi:predicted DNA-binding transcriptional regulator AlpA